VSAAASPHWLHAPRAWIAGSWQANVAFEVGADGHFSQVLAGVPPPPGARTLPGPVLPGLVNAHSHAFQRAFAGLAERRSSERDDFWSWRDRMYGVANRITPDQLRAVATQLYSEMLQGGYTQVCEFHYLHHAADGQRYANPAEMSLALVQAAQAAGIGITLLPVLYQRAGFTQPQLRDDQRRFATTVDQVLQLQAAVRGLRAPQVSAGVAIHSLRAATPEAISALQQALAGDPGPIHLHIAEQTGEVDDCLAATGARPIEWLARHVALDARWHLVHATHALPSEIEAVARSGAGVVLCPSTEANLGDGLADLPGWLQHRAVLSIGSDSHMARSWVDELRWLEYGQRLALRRRNVAARPDQAADGLDATAAVLLQATLAGGAAAAGLPRWGLQAGARADLLVLDEQAPGLLGVPATRQLDALVFATDAPAFQQVWVGGQCAVEGGRHRGASATSTAFQAAMHSLWNTSPS
jgi:formimidoylglutamate deiminase